MYDRNSERKIEFTIPANTLRDALKKEVDKIYMGKGVFLEKKPNVALCYCKKSTKFKQNDFIRGFAVRGDPDSQAKVVDFGFYSQASQGMVDENDNEKEEDLQDREPDVLDDLLASSAEVGTKRTSTQQHQTRSKVQTNSN